MSKVRRLLAGCGELAGIRSEFATEEERKQAAQEYFSELFDPDLAVERSKTMEDLRKARRIAYAFRFICRVTIFPVSRTGGRSEVACQHAQTSPSSGRRRQRSEDDGGPRSILLVFAHAFLLGRGVRSRAVAPRPAV